MQEDEKINPLETELSAIEEAALDSDPAADSDSPRDAVWLRWIKFAAVIIVPAIILGLGFLFADYINQFQAGSHHEHNLAQNRIEHDTVGAMKFRFWIGAGIGGGLGLIYVARCIIRRADP